MLKKLTMFIIFCLILTNSMAVFAVEDPETSDDKMIENGYITTFDFQEIEPMEEIESIEPNSMEREGQVQEIIISGNLSYSTYEGRAIGDNTDPNNAYLVENDYIMQGFIEAESEMRWYGFILEEKSKSSILLQMEQTLDADIYLYQLNGNQLELVGGSASEGSGQEYCTQVLDSGIYYFAISGYSGTGKFGFAYYQSSQDADYEVNDLVELATEVPLNTDIIGVIDHPSDYDFYKFTITNPMVMSYSISSSNNYAFEYAKGGTALILEDNLLQLTQGTYYFYVYSKDGTYSSDNTYQINLNKIADLADDNSAKYLAISQEAKIVFQTNANGSQCYVNGNPIDINYKFYEHFSDQGGFQTYDIQIRQRNDVYAFIDEEYSPGTVFFRYGSNSNMDIKEKNLLELYYYSKDDFYYIHCMCSGGYASNQLWKNLNNVHVFIDPDTGKLVDIESFNYFYDFAQGSNKMSYTRPYSLKLYYKKK